MHDGFSAARVSTWILLQGQWMIEWAYVLYNIQSNANVIVWRNRISQQIAVKSTAPLTSHIMFEIPSQELMGGGGGRRAWGREEEPGTVEWNEMAESRKAGFKAARETCQSKVWPTAGPAGLWLCSVNSRLTALPFCVRCTHQRAAGWIIMSCLMLLSLSLYEVLLKPVALLHNWKGDE